MMNITILQGRLVQDPQVRRTDSGKTCTSFTLAVERDYGERQADFLDCVAWQQTGDFVGKYFLKGDPILIQGCLQNRSWEDRQGNKRTKTEVIAARVWFCGGKPKPAPDPMAYPLLDETDEKLPF